MTDEIIPSYFCRRIRGYLHGEKMEDISQKVIVHCGFYPNLSSAEKCQFSGYKGEKCLVKLAVQKEAKVELSKLHRITSS